MSKKVQNLCAAYLAAALSGVAADAQALTQKPILANFIVEEVGGSERINFAGKLRMLSQRIASASCHLNAGIEPEDSREILSSGAEEFQRIVEALENGDEGLGIIGPESRRKTLMAIESLKAAWDPFYQASNELLADHNDSAAFEYISANNMELLSAAQLLVSEVVAEYSDPVAITQANALLVDISGRQRMLLQKIAKESCALSMNNPTLGAKEQLEATMATFQTSLLALRDGLTSAGINPPPNDEISSGLNALWEDWVIVRDELQKIKDGTDPDHALQADVFKRLNVDLRNMNSIVGLYTAAAKQDL